jgi:integrase
MLANGILNEDATDILQILINTGMRPSEVTGLAADDVILNAEIPYVVAR